jgi:hypothetical protein
MSQDRGLCVFEFQDKYGDKMTGMENYVFRTHTKKIGCAKEKCDHSNGEKFCGCWVQENLINIAKQIVK